MNIQGSRILVVDDSPTVRRLAELILTQQGYSVHTAEDGEKGLQIASQVAPDAILIDYVMPKMNGHAFCKQIRADERMKNTPLILISSKGEAIGQSFEEEFGIVDYFSKPFEPEELVQKLEDVLRARPHPAPMGEAASSLDGAPPEEMLDAFQERFDRIVRGYFQKDFPLLMKNVLSDTLRECGVIKSNTLIFSGDLSRVPLPDVVNFVDNSRLSGRLSIFSGDVFGEIFLDEGKFVFATVCRKGTHHFLTDLMRADGRLQEKTIQKAVQEGQRRGLSVGQILVDQGVISSQELMKYLHRHAQDAFNMILEVKSGQFFLEQDELPLFLQDITFRLSLTSVLLDGLRRLDEKELAATEFKDETMVLIRLITNDDALESFDLGDKELEVFAIIDGKRSLAEVIRASGLDPLEVKRICYTLRRVGLLRPKAG